MKRFILAIVALAAFAIPLAVASATDTITVTGGARSCDTPGTATGTITGAPDGAVLEFLTPAPANIAIPATINGTSWSISYGGTVPTGSFGLNWQVKVNGEVVASDTLQVPACTPTTPPPTDVCPNLDGVQETVPDGYELKDGQCIEKTTPPTIPPTVPPTTPPTSPPVTPPAETPQQAAPVPVAAKFTG